MLKIKKIMQLNNKTIAQDEHVNTTENVKYKQAKNMQHWFCKFKSKKNSNNIEKKAQRQNNLDTKS